MSNTKQYNATSDVLAIPREHFQKIEGEYHRLSAKCKKQDHQIKAFSNITEFVNRLENELKVHKKRAQQYESAYISSEAKLGHILKTWINSSQQKEGHLLDIDFIENLLQLKTEDIYSKQYPNVWSGLPKQKLDTPGSKGELEKDGEVMKSRRNTGEHKNHLEEDGDSHVKKHDLEEDGDSHVKKHDLEADVEGKQIETNVDHDTEKHDIEEDGCTVGEETCVVMVDAVNTVKRSVHKTDSLTETNQEKIDIKKDKRANIKHTLISRSPHFDTDSEIYPSGSKVIPNVELSLDKMLETGKMNTDGLQNAKISSTSIDRASCSHVSNSNNKVENNVAVNRQISSYSNEVIDNLEQDKRKLLDIINQFKKETPEAWKAFTETRQYEDLIKNLRLEVASCRIQNSEIKMLLVAKQSENVDALTKQIHNLYKELTKLNKQLTAKHALLHSLNTEYEQVKKEREELRSQLGGIEKSSAIIKCEKESETGKTSVEHAKDKGASIDSEEWRSRFEELQMNFNCQQKGMMEMKNIIERLRSEKEKMIEQCEEYNSIIDDLKKERPKVVDDITSDNSYVQLKEQNERLKADLATYKHELETKKKDDAIIEAQIRLYQDDFRKEIEERKNERQESEEEKSQLLNLVKSMEIKYNKCLEELNKVREQNRPSEQHIRQLQLQFDNIIKQLDRERAENRTLKYRLQNQHPIMGRCSMLPSQPLTRNAQYACNDITVDGPTDDEQNPAMTSTQSAPGNLVGVKSIDEGRYIPGSADGILVENEKSNSKLVCPQCYREFNPVEDLKYKDHCKKCVM